MKITVLGAGAMGTLFGGYLSRHSQVCLVDVNRELVQKIKNEGVIISEDGQDTLFFPGAETDTRGAGLADLVIVFVKAAYTLQALEANRHIIGPDTYLMSLQNGIDHDKKLLQFADADHVILGSTQHNSSVIAPGHIHHGGSGKTFIGLAAQGSKRIETIAELFTLCGIDCEISDDIRRQIWNKLFLNTSASALTAVLQVPLGYIEENPYARALMEMLAREAVAVANAETPAFDEAVVVAAICAALRGMKGGYTSIYADVKNGVRTEVDTISGSVVSAAAELGIEVPYHRMLVALIHALEEKA